MTYSNHRQTYIARAKHRYTYPNAAEPGYFKDRFLDGITAVASGIGIVTLLMYFLTF